MHRVKEIDIERDRLIPKPLLYQSHLYQSRTSGRTLFLLACIHPVTSCRAGWIFHPSTSFGSFGSSRQAAPCIQAIITCANSFYLVLCILCIICIFTIDIQIIPYCQISSPTVHHQKWYNLPTVNASGIRQKKQYRLDHILPLLPVFVVVSGSLLIAIFIISGQSMKKLKPMSLLRSP